MPRRPRVHFTNALYHVILRGNNRQDIFFCDDDYRLWESLLADAIRRYDARVHCYCWMTNHVHLVAQVGVVPLGAVVRYAAARYSRTLNKRLGHTGHRFERRHRAILVADDRYLMGLVRYIHANPVRAGLATSIDAYRWTSHAEYAGSRTSKWLTTNCVLQAFDETPAMARSAYLKFMGVDATQEFASHSDSAPILTPQGVASSRLTVGRVHGAQSNSRGAPSLEDILARHLEQSGLTEALLVGPSRARAISTVRTKIAAAAIREGAASLAAVARRLNRSESAISQALAHQRKGARHRQ